ncbi:UNVERIFIED_CONTAM: hypothetical protein K2H54_039221 [Gekko kuhli]
MDTSPKDIQERRMRVTCSVPYHCPEEPLKLTIRGLEGTRLGQRTTISNGVIQTVVDVEMSWEDHGKSLICSLRRRNGSEISKSTMQLEVKCEFCLRMRDLGTVDAPKDVRVIASPGTIIQEGETLSLECTIKSSNPEVSEYLWYKDDQLMYDQPTLNGIEFETKGDRHSGAYRCEAKNGFGSKKSEELRIDVQYPPKEVKVWGMPPGGIKEGEKVDLQCSSQGNPPISHYEWYKLPQTDVFRNSDQLHFNAIQLEHAGTYYCVANNSLGQSESSQVTLDVLYAPKDVQLVIENEQLPIKETDTVRLNCSFSHSKPSNDIWYEWYKDKFKLSNQGNPLDFPANLQQAGDYTCEACNAIKCVPAQPVTIDIHYAPKGVKVVQEPENSIHEGNHVNLRCKVEKANPKVDSYRWYKDGVRQHLDSAPAELTIYQVTSAHSGTYWCEATNSVATSRSQQIRLNVYYGPRNISLSLERQVAVTEGMNVSLLCAADANPPPHSFELYRDKEVLMQRRERILLLRKVQVKDSGDYHCKAYNTISPKPEQLCNNRAPERAVNSSLAFLNEGAEEAVSYAVLRFPPGASEEQDDYARVNAPRVALDPSNEEVVYSVVKKPEATSKGDTKHDYENVVAQKEEELHYSSLVNLAPRPQLIYRDSETDSESEESIQYAALKH